MANAFNKDPRAEMTDYGPLIALKFNKDASSLKADPSKTELVGKLVEAADAYCQTLDCSQLLIYR